MIENLFSRFTSLPWLRERTIFLTRHGSHAYGTNTPTSDLDVKGVAVPPANYFLGFHQKFEQAESRTHEGKPTDADLVVYDIRKFFNLAADCNPSIIEVLFTDPIDWLHVAPPSGKLLGNRDLFLSRKARHTFSGYAVSQLKRIKTHRRWLLHPPKAPPTREEYGLGQTREVPKEQLGAAEAALRKELDMQGGPPPFDEQAAAARKLGYDDNFIDYLRREQQYRRARQEWDQFQTWKAQRNPARAAIEAQFGYDCKHACHLVRLLRMCGEILATGRVLVRRPDAEELLAIRRGAWTYDQLIEWSEREDAAMGEIEARSPLPKAPDRHRLDALCVEIAESML